VKPHRHPLHGVASSFRKTSSMAFSDYNTALVTGASAGIGWVVVERLRKEGLEVHALARNRERLAQLAVTTGCKYHFADVRDNAAIANVVSGLEIDVLVNNAGLQRMPSISECNEENMDVTIDVNLTAVLHLVRLVMPAMVARDRGHIINISSTAAIHRFESSSMHHAAKAGIHVLSQQRRIDGHGHRVRVTQICLSRTETNLLGTAIGGDMAEARKRFFYGYEVLQPADIADAIAFVIRVRAHANISNIEIVSTMQMPGGLRYAKSGG
jgi:NADP-dependent 3-hydroxy acid dehydrogenase YdfG